MDYQAISLFLLIFFSFVFLYFDFVYQKISNKLFIIWIIFFIILAYLSWFFHDYLLVFIFRTIILFIIFYFLYLQWRIAWWDFKLYFILSGFLILFLYNNWNIKINWLYFDMYVIIYSLVAGFSYLILRYIFLWIKKWFKFQIDPTIKIKLSNDRKDALLHFTLLTRSVIYVLLFYIITKFSTSNQIIAFTIIVLEFVFIGYLFNFLREKIFLKFDWFIRKKEIKWFSIIFFILTAIYLFYLKHYSLIFLLILFTFIEYIISVLQLNFDTKIKKVEDLKQDEILSIRNFPIHISKEMSLLEEIELDDDILKYLKDNNIKNVEIIEQIPYWIFLVFGIIYFLYKALF